MLLEESVRNTEGILEDEKRRAAESLESNLRQIAELDEQVKELTRHKVQAEEGLVEEKARRQALEGQMQRLEEESSRKLEELQRQLAELPEGQLARHQEEAKRLAEEEGRARAELATEKAQKVALEAQLQNLTNEHRAEVSSLQEEVARAQDLAGEKERELEELRLKNVSRCEELRDLQKTVSKLKAELASAEALKEREAKMEGELQGFLEVARTREAEVGRLEKQSKEQQSTIARLEKLTAASKEQQHSEAEAWKREAGQQRQKTSELAKLLDASKASGEAEAGAPADGRGAGAEPEGRVQSRGREAERKADHINSLEQDRAILHRQLLEKDAESKDLRRGFMAESEKSKKLEERLRLLQSEMATGSRAAERCSAMKAEAQSSQEQAEKLRLSVEALQKELSGLSKREEALGQELKAWQEKAFQKEQLLAGRQQELAGAQALVAEQQAGEQQHRGEVGQLQAELSRTKEELLEAASTKERLLQQEQLLQQLQAENSGQVERLAALQQAHSQLAEEKRELAEKASQGRQSLGLELAQAKQKHALELEAARLHAEKLLAGSKREAEEAQKKLEAMASTCEDTKHQLAAQVSLCSKNTPPPPGIFSRWDQLKEKTADLQAQLVQKEQAIEHYKTQMEKARTHYDAKKQQNQELLQKLKGLEHLEKENAELKAESERLAKELQHTALQATESELSLKNVTSQVRVLQAQLDFSDRQLREQGKVQAALETLKGRETFRQGSADISTDSLELNTSDEGQPLNSTSRKSRRSLSESGPVESSKRESLESLYFTPIPTRSRSKLENSIDSIGNITLDSGRKALSGRRRTTQLINITMIKVRGDGQESVKTRLRSAAASSSSTRSLASLPPQESLTRLAASSPDGASGHAALKSLPGYRPATRSSLRHSQDGGANTARSSFYAASCDDEPEQLDGWNRIAELQQRNRICPPHLKTCYPLESRPCPLLTTITDEEVMTGDPKETLRRATMLPSQILEGPRVATRQQRKRLSDEPQTGPGTPERSSTCFPRPQTPKGRNEDRKQGRPVGDRKSKAQAADKQSERRQSLAFSILNTPKKLGNSLLRRGANRKVTPKNSPRSGSRRSPRNATCSPALGHLPRPLCCSQRGPFLGWGFGGDLSRRIPPPASPLSLPSPASPNCPVSSPAGPPSPGRVFLCSLI
uniref:Nuclear mitotic apparatus protein 1 n=1 Tax=Naja naja TaxID=35670 RepID=A0A8C6XNX7_NAJNA